MTGKGGQHCNDVAGGAVSVETRISTHTHYDASERGYLPIRTRGAGPLLLQGIGSQQRSCVSRRWWADLGAPEVVICVELDVNAGLSFEYCALGHLWSVVSINQEVSELGMVTDAGWHWSLNT